MACAGWLAQDVSAEAAAQGAEMGAGRPACKNGSILTVAVLHDPLQQGQLIPPDEVDAVHRA